MSLDTALREQLAAAVKEPLREHQVTWDRAGGRWQCSCDWLKVFPEGAWMHAAAAVVDALGIEQIPGWSAPGSLANPHVASNECAGFGCVPVFTLAASSPQENPK